MTRTLLIDADIVAFRASAALQRDYDWGDGVTSRVTDMSETMRAAEEYIESAMVACRGTDIIICLSDDVTNFRNSIYPPYKQHRKSSERPELLYDIKDKLAERWPSAVRPRMEADDVMGILATEPHKGTRIIVSEDKDMKTIPGWLFNPRTDKRPRKVSTDEAQKFLMWQALTGDPTDGYPGCPGCGKKQADKLIYENHEWFRSERELMRGKNKGQIKVEWSLEDALHEWNIWSAVLSAYFRAGLTEKDAIIQVSMARILKHQDMDGSRIKPWVPDMLN